MPPLRAALANHALVRATAAYLCSDIAEWALWVGVLVHAYDVGGARWAGFASLGLLVPAMLVAPVAGRIADGARPLRALLVVYTVEAIGLTAAAAAAFAEAHVGLVVALTAVSVTAITFVRPAFAVVVPGVVGSAGELTAANLLTGWVDSATVLAGPLLASAVLAVWGSAAVFAVCAALTAVGAFVMAPLLTQERLPADLPAGPAHDRAAATLRRALAGLRRRPGALGLLAVLAGQYVLIGGLDLLYVVLALDEFGRSEATAGILSALFGVGAVAGGVLTTTLIGRRALAAVISAALATIAAAMLALGIVTTLAWAVATLVLAGLARSVVDVTGRMLVQRAAPPDALASTFAVIEVLTSAGIAAGSLIVQTTVAASGAATALFVLGGFYALLLVATAVSLARVARVADVPIVAIRLLRRVPIFAVLPPVAIEGVARAAAERSVPAGTTLVTEGAAGHEYIVIARGEVTVSIAGEYVRTMGPGTGFGEIALLADVPRTATVTATTDVALYEIDRAAFLTAVTGHDTSARTAWAVARAHEPGLTGGP